MSTTKKVWIAWVNADLTEGRSFNYPLAICETKATALRLGKKRNVQGSDAHVSEYLAIKDGGHWVAPFYLEPATKEDERLEAWRLKQETVIAKMKAAGMTEEEIKTMKERVE